MLAIRLSYHPVTRATIPPNKHIGSHCHNSGWVSVFLQRKKYVSY